MSSEEQLPHATFDTIRGKTIVFLGNLTIKRSEGVRLAKAAGATVGRAVVHGKTDVVVEGTGADNQVAEAAANGVLVLTEAAFLELYGVGTTVAKRQEEDRKRKACEKETTASDAEEERPRQVVPNTKGGFRQSPERTPKDRIIDEMRLVVAAEYGANAEIVELLDLGTNVNCTNMKGITPLSIAAEHNHESTCALLLARGADVSLGDQYQSTALHIAAHTGNTSVCRLLLRHGADVNVADTVLWTPLHMAARRGVKEMVALLLQSGALVNAGNTDGTTPVFFAANYGHAAVIRQLVANGAGLTRGNTHGFCAIHYSRNVATSEELLKSGADVVVGIAV